MRENSKDVNKTFVGDFISIHQNGEHALCVKGRVAEEEGDYDGNWGTEESKGYARPHCQALTATQ